MSPKRIQRKRVSGWRLADHSTNAVYVGRGSKSGNPFRVERASSERGGPKDMWAVVLNGTRLVRFDGKADAAGDAVDRFRRWVAENRLKSDIVAELAGKDLCCWCPDDQPCHASVLLEIANGEAP